MLSTSISELPGHSYTNQCLMAKCPAANLLAALTGPYIPAPSKVSYLQLFLLSWHGKECHLRLCQQQRTWVNYLMLHLLSWLNYPQLSNYSAAGLLAMLMGPCAISARNCAIFSASAACAAVSLWCISSCLAAVFLFLH